MAGLSPCGSGRPCIVFLPMWKPTWVQLKFIFSKHFLWSGLSAGVFGGRECKSVYAWLLQSHDPARAAFYGVCLPLFLTWSNQRTLLPFQSFKSLVALGFTGRDCCSATAVLCQAILADCREEVLSQKKWCTLGSHLVLGMKLWLPCREIYFCSS